MRKCRVLIIDDSRTMQELISQALRSDPMFQVVGIASTGKDALLMARSLRPDAVTLDVILPDIDGLELLSRLVREAGTRVLVVSALSQPDSTVAIQALEVGALDCLAKPSTSRGTTRFRQSLIEHMRQIADVPSERIQQLAQRSLPQHRVRLAQTVVVIGSSAGGPLLLRELVPKLPADLPAAIVLVQHLPEVFTRQLATQLAAASEIRVKQAQPGDALIEGTALIAPGDEVVKIEWLNNNWGCLAFSPHGQSPHGVMPWIDAAMSTAALLYGKRSIGVLLSGMGRDGVDGLRKIQKAGGLTIAQDEATSLVYGMPRAAAEAGVADRILPIDKIAGELVAHVRSLAEGK